jgi:hypothetical protein
MVWRHLHRHQLPEVNPATHSGSNTGRGAESGVDSGDQGSNGSGSRPGSRNSSGRPKGGNSSSSSNNNQEGKSRKKSRRRDNNNRGEASSLNLASREGNRKKQTGGDLRGPDTILQWVRRTRWGPLLPNAWDETEGGWGAKIHRQPLKPARRSPLKYRRHPCSSNRG